ncbi:MAG TPA: RsmB/NOP family class I SAM-dependent RNA methyltransferase [Caproiciproducens sp.]|nr:RsmB/NOP family class I SAM-dependent RNA methyltransferase [Caproiciproducens sp.]
MLLLPDDCLSIEIHPLRALLFTKRKEIYWKTELILLILLPQEFKNRMKRMLNGEFDEFADCYSQHYFRGIRLNPLKCRLEILKQALPFPLVPAPFSPLSFYIPAEAEKIGSLPMHHAGAFYVQEPSASSAVTVLNPQPGDKVLDLCAAPGGKSTQIASLLGGKGLLWSNEVVRSRANILLSNLERCGVSNAVVSSCRPDALCAALAGYFDKVLVDAPCSGEGMFRKDDQAIQEWSPEHVQSCAVRQLAILESACLALRENGTIVYSTCTFSPEENEGVVEKFLERHKDFALLDCGQSFGRPAALKQARRIYPMDGGEGHFVASLKRLFPNECRVHPYEGKSATDSSLAESLYAAVYSGKRTRRIDQVGGYFLLLPDELPRLNGLGVLRAGVLLGEAKKNRAEPAHAAFMASSPKELNTEISLNSDSEDIIKFLHGEEIPIDSALKGYAGVSVDGVITGFGKCSNGRLKNHYPKGLRNH